MSFQTIAYSVQGQLTVTTVVSGLWQKTHPKLAPLFTKLVKITCMTVSHGFTHPCLLCGLFTDHILSHTLCYSEVVWSTDSIKM